MIAGWAQKQLMWIQPGGIAFGPFNVVRNSLEDVVFSDYGVHSCI